MAKSLLQADAKRQGDESLLREVQASVATVSPPSEGKLVLPFWKDLLMLVGLSDWWCGWRETIWRQALTPQHGNMRRLGPLPGSLAGLDHAAS